MKSRLMVFAEFWRLLKIYGVQESCLFLVAVSAQLSVGKRNQAPSGWWRKSRKLFLSVLKQTAREKEKVIALSSSLFQPALVGASHRQAFLRKIAADSKAEIIERCQALFELHEFDAVMTEAYNARDGSLPPLALDLAGLSAHVVGNEEQARHFWEQAEEARGNGSRQLALTGDRLLIVGPVASEINLNPSGWPYDTLVLLNKSRLPGLKSPVVAYYSGARINELNGVCSAPDILVVRGSALSMLPDSLKSRARVNSFPDEAMLRYLRDGVHWSTGAFGGGLSALNRTLTDLVKWSALSGRLSSQFLLDGFSFFLGKLAYEPWYLAGSLRSTQANVWTHRFHGLSSNFLWSKALLMSPRVHAAPEVSRTVSMSLTEYAHALDDRQFGYGEKH